MPSAPFNYAINTIYALQLRHLHHSITPSTPSTTFNYSFPLESRLWPTNGSSDRKVGVKQGSKIRLETCGKAKARSSSSVPLLTGIGQERLISLRRGTLFRSDCSFAWWIACSLNRLLRLSLAYFDSLYRHFYSYLRFPLARSKVLRMEPLLSWHEPI